MPLIEITTENAVSREQLRAFHLTGRGLEALAPEGPLDAALLDEIALPRLEDSYPLHIGDWEIGFGESTPLLFLCAAIQSARREARQSFAQQLKECGQRLRELLGVDDRTQVATTAENVAQSLGARASAYLDASALAGALGRRPNPTLPMEHERRARCEAALAVIQAAIQDLKSLPSVILVHSGGVPEIPFPIAIQYEEAADACDSALALANRQVNRFVAVWKALRIARLEVDSAFDPSIHTEAFDHFDCSMAHPKEIAALPVVAVFESAERIEKYLASFARLMQSGLPVQVLISDWKHAAFDPLGYQDAFLFRTSIAAPAHLIAGLSEMASTLRPSAALVAVGESWEEASLLVLGRVVPLWRYHPDLGENWFQRFALEAPAASEQLTFAHAAARMPGYRNHFRLVPAGTDLAFPFFLVSNQKRAVFTREVANLSAAAETRWRFLRELAEPKIVKGAAPDTGDTARLEGAREAVLRVIAMLKTGD
jgi:tetratricopeptide (TPR) repeat protein